MSEIYGNVTGLSPSATKTLQRIYRRRVPLECIATPELLRSLSEASQQTGRQVGALVHRSGQVDYVIVGDASRLVLPDIGRLRAAEGRFRGLRLIHTHLHGEPLTRDDVVDLVRLRLDLVAALQLTPEGAPKGLVYAYNIPPSPLPAPAPLPVVSSLSASPSSSSSSVVPVAADGADARISSLYRAAGPIAPGQLDVDFGKLIASLEAEFARVAKAQPVRGKDGRAILVYVGEKKNREDPEERLFELRELARTAGVDVVHTVAQLRDKLDPKFVLGRGKLDDVVLCAIELDAEVLIFDRNLSPAQSSAIAKHTDLKIIDRTQLILDIFAQRAESRDGKLQVELAQLKYSLPRLALKDDSLSRLTGGIGGRGPGETKIEIGRRRAKERVTHLEAQLKTLARQRQQRRRRRARLSVPVVAIVGYTNAGKTTLLNTLTYSDALAEDKLFATLDTRSRRLRFPEEREVVLTDTVGFIHELPSDLFAAFRATFEEAADSDLILHVVDAADPARERHIETTDRVLKELALEKIPRILVFNKADRLAATEGETLRRGFPDAMVIAAVHRETTRKLLDRIAQLLEERWAESALYSTAAPPEPERATTPQQAGAPLEPASSEDSGDAGDPEGLTTLDEMVGARSRRRSPSHIRA